MLSKKTKNKINMKKKKEYITYKILNWNRKKLMKKNMKWIKKVKIINTIKIEKEISYHQQVLRG